MSRRSPFASCARPRRAVGWAGLAFAALAWACGGDGGLGADCERQDDCEPSLQCFASVCQDRCQRRTDCGDGHVCEGGLCVPSPIADGGACARELDCAAGLACRLAPRDDDGDGALAASCAPDHAGAGLDSPCRADDECRNGTCALGRCIDLCADDADCPAEHACAGIPRPTGAAAVPAFRGCLPARGLLTWTLPVFGPRSDTLLTVPDTARSVAVVIEGSDPLQPVGLAQLSAPSGAALYTVPRTSTEFYANAIRHRPAPRVSIVDLPGDDGPLAPGAYPITISSFRPGGAVGTTTPRATAYAKLDDRAVLDLHFYFLDLADHPCAAALDDGRLDATSARRSQHFQGDLLEGLHEILTDAGVDVGDVTYDDLTSIHDLDGIEAADLDALLAQSSRAGGVSIFFVRTLAPAGLTAMIGRAPGAPGLAGTPASGMAIATDALCFRSWPQVTRLVAHELARHLGLSRAVEPDGGSDRLTDTGDERGNLLHFADDGGTALTDGQRRMLRRSPVLR